MMTLIQKWLDAAVKIAADELALKAL